MGKVISRTKPAVEKFPGAKRMSWGSDGGSLGHHNSGAVEWEPSTLTCNGILFGHETWQFFLTMANVSMRPSSCSHFPVCFKNEFPRNRVNLEDCLHNLSFSRFYASHRNTQSDKQKEGNFVIIIMEVAPATPGPDYRQAAWGVARFRTHVVSEHSQRLSEYILWLL